ncbi:Acid-sensing ion channel 4 [Araneus ventricosus]|uniref:Acid-sensing ion channel 4 n=1 Tax=Araneus ventricosus TaxID=182803 RepID=A0A4Y2A9A3_ARAVE|nr:Acid-sensing ion channel 4 [Araneus ventricosus]
MNLDTSLDGDVDKVKEDKVFSRNLQLTMSTNSISKNMNSNSKDLLKDTIGTSPLPAVSQIWKAETKLWKLFWLFVLLLSSCGCAYNVKNFLTVFFKYPVLIDVSVQNRDSLEFPAVTICNLNRMHELYTNCVLEDMPWFPCFHTSFDEDIVEKGSGGVLILSERRQHTFISKATIQSKINYKSKSKEFLNHYKNLDNRSMYCYGYRLHELVKNCTFNSTPCQSDDFSYFQTIQYGNCFTFNNAQRHQNPFKVIKAGSDTGLDLEIDAMLNSYLDITPSAGIRIVVHNPYEDPNPVQDGINLNPGYETQISITKSSIKRLPAPYRDQCYDYKSNNGNRNSTNSQFNCIRECMQQTNQELCGCIDPFIPTKVEASRCDLHNSSQMSCLDGLVGDMNKNGLPCHCPLPCMSTTYDVKTTSAKLKFTRIHSMVSSLKIKGDPQCDQSEFFNTDSRMGNRSSIPNRKKRFREYSQAESRTKLKLFYASLDHTIYAQKAMFSDSELYAHLGGHLGLWLGLSLIALFEYAEYMLLLPRLFLNRSTSKIAN